MRFLACLGESQDPADQARKKSGNSFSMGNPFSPHCRGVALPVLSGSGRARDTPIPRLNIMMRKLLIASLLVAGVALSGSVLAQTAAPKAAATAAEPASAMTPKAATKTHHAKKHHKHHKAAAPAAASTAG
ncbi:hypothetical protein [Rhodanobacter terrae]|uniref:Uncharacterized protein n=1 Tax=Rhodanobacter terrae TaxID=418647 RepID=A0ABW0SX86_9GAMM